MRPFAGRKRARKARAEAGLGDPGAGGFTSSGATSQSAGDPFAEFQVAVERLNRDFFVCQFAGAVPICSFHHDLEMKRRHLTFMKPADFRLKFLNETYLVGHNSDGSERFRDLGTGWMESRDRRQYDRAGMFPKGDVPPNTLNLWQGWGVEPKPGSWDEIAWHLKHVICNGNEDHCNYLIGLLAYWVQNPEKVGEVAIVLRGKKGAGKGAFARILKEWFAHHFVHITQPRHLTGNFNAHLADCLFLFADEVTWGGDKQGEGVLKGMITEDTVQIEPKGINTFSLRNRLKFLIASNSDWVVPVTEDERRYLVLDVSEARRNNRPYFDKLHDAIKDGEAAAMLHDMLQLDLSGFSHRDVPHTDGLNHQKVEGLDSVGRWWMSCLTEGRIVGGHLHDDPLDHRSGSGTKDWPGELLKPPVHEAYPHELSGGMAQRIAFAAATVSGAEIIVADEPTKGLDAAMRDRVAALLAGVTERGGALLTITHDVSLARALGGRLAILRAGRVVEAGAASDVLAAPASDYGRALISAEPRNWPCATSPEHGPIRLSCRDLMLARGGRTILRGLDLDLHAGERVAVSGPSGSGKTTLLNALAGLLTPAKGTVSRMSEVPTLAVQKLYQDPPSAFPPARTLARTIRDLERRHRLPAERLQNLLDRLGIAPVLLDRLPGEVSGGELQRISLARALALRPAVLLADEPTSRLDLVTQKALMDLLGEMADRDRLAVVLVTHDPNIASGWAHRVVDVGALAGPPPKEERATVL